MRWLMTFIAGALLGAAGLFAWLSMQPDDEPAPVAQAAAVAGAPPDPLAGRLPPPPQVEPDLTEADLPLRPERDAKAALAALPEVGGTGQPARLIVPVEGVRPYQLADTFHQARGKERRHEALDVMAPRGTRVLAAADGKVVKLFNSKQGGLTVYQFDPGEKYAYYYAHLDRYADGIEEGKELKRGDLVGFVGATGNADPKAPHLHFAVVELTPEKQWWKGTPVNPYPLMVQ